jgi:hypothetical protein
MDRPRRESRQPNGIMLRGLSQLTFATKSANSGNVTANARTVTPTADKVADVSQVCNVIFLYHPITDYRRSLRTFIIPESDPTPSSVRSAAIGDLSAGSGCETPPPPKNAAERRCRQSPRPSLRRDLPCGISALIGGARRSDTPGAFTALLAFDDLDPLVRLLLAGYCQSIRSERWPSRCA